MPEPTDHRAEAESFLETAHDLHNRGDIHADEAITAALIGIGHALLALTDAQPSPQINLSGYATRAQIRDALQAHPKAEE